MMERQRVTQIPQHLFSNRRHQNRMRQRQPWYFFVKNLLGFFIQLAALGLQGSDFGFAVQFIKPGMAPARPVATTPAKFTASAASIFIASATNSVCRGGAEHLWLAAAPSRADAGKRVKPVCSTTALPNADVLFHLSLLYYFFAPSPRGANVFLFLTSA